MQAGKYKEDFADYVNDNAAEMPELKALYDKAISTNVENNSTIVQTSAAKVDIFAPK